MKFLLKGLTKSSSIISTKPLNLRQYSFDLRPRSFNFVQARKIKEMITHNSDIHNFTLIFENEKDFVVVEVLKDLRSVLFDTQNVMPEFFGITPLEELEKFNEEYIWHYHDKEKIRDIAFAKNLKRIVFHHEDLAYLNSRGELHGFFNLFSDYFERIEIEIQLDWNAEIITSILEFFPISYISFEITNLVELSYQNPDTNLINNHILKVQKIINTKKEDNFEDPNIK